MKDFNDFNVKNLDEKKLTVNCSENLTFEIKVARIETLCTTIKAY